MGVPIVSVNPAFTFGGFSSSFSLLAESFSSPIGSFAELVASHENVEHFGVAGTAPKTRDDAFSIVPNANGVEPAVLAAEDDAFLVVPDANCVETAFLAGDWKEQRVASDWKDVLLMAIILRVTFFRRLVAGM